MIITLVEVNTTDPRPEMSFEKPSVVVGRDARFLDVLYRLDPVRATAFITKQMKDLLPPARAGARSMT